MLRALMIVAALALISLAPNSAHADRHDVHQWGAAQSFAPVHVKQARHAKRGERQKHHQRRFQERSHVAGGSGHVVRTRGGATASVSTVARPHFQCLLDKLDAAGYQISFMGGYARRGNSSAHPTGNALDINQIGRNIVTRRLPSNATQMARDCGLMHGAEWSRPDTGHFEMPHKYGYVYRARRVRYAYR